MNEPSKNEVARLTDEGAIVIQKDNKQSQRVPDGPQTSV